MPEDGEGTVEGASTAFGRNSARMISNLHSCSVPTPEARFHYGRSKRDASRLMDGFSNVSRIHWYDRTPSGVVRGGFARAAEANVNRGTATTHRSPSTME